MIATKKLMMSAAISALLAAPLVAKADAFTFNPNGAGATGAVTADLIDQAPGNALAQGVATQQSNGTYTVNQGTNFNLYYQSNLSVLKASAPSGTSQIVYSNGGDGKYFTFTAGFGETVTAANAAAGTASFSLNPNGSVNFFRIYAAAAPGGNDLTGIGFTSPRVILEGRVVAESSSGFAINPNVAATALDQFNANNYPDKRTVSGSGASSIDVQVTSFDAGYFPSLTNGSIITSQFNTSTVTPFNQADPSRCFASQTADCAITPSIGSINGFNGTDFLLQADANEAINSTTVARVPEPATTAMLGLGLALVGFFGISRKKQA